MEPSTAHSLRETSLAGFGKRDENASFPTEKILAWWGFPGITPTAASQQPRGNTILREKYTVGKLFAIFKRESHAFMRRISLSEYLYSTSAAYWP